MATTNEEHAATLSWLAGTGERWPESWVDACRAGMTALAERDALVSSNRQLTAKLVDAEKRMRKAMFALTEVETDVPRLTEVPVTQCR